MTKITSPLTLYIYRPNAQLREIIPMGEIDREPEYDWIKKTMAAYLGADASLEHVSVLFEGKPSDMFVDECGAITIGSRLPLPVNAAATEIYHAASKSRGDDMTDAPQIHGVAIVCSRRIWF